MDDMQIEALMMLQAGGLKVFIRNDVAIPAEGFGLTKYRDRWSEVSEIRDFEDEPCAFYADGNEQYSALWATELSDVRVFKEIDWSRQLDRGKA